MSDKSEHPLRIYNVLEEEYELLHGVPAPLPKTENGDGGAAESRLKNIIKHFHQKQHTAICLSGGGIRSATFGLGVLQGLAHNDLLQKFSYLSTVSGGGYVGGWLSAWIHRHPRGIEGVQEDLPGEQPENVLRPEAEPISHLRSYSNYLTPRLGLLSADTWTLIALVIRNLILNWLVLIPLMLAALALPRLFVSLSQLSPQAEVRIGIFAVGFICGVIMISYVAINRPSITKQHYDQRTFLKWCLAPMLISATCFALYWAWFSKADSIRLEQALTFHWLDSVDGIPRIFGFIAFGVALHLTAWFAYTGFVSRSWSLAAKEFVGLAVNGILGGILVWAFATRVFPNPASSSSLPSGTSNIGWRSIFDSGDSLLSFAVFGVPVYLIVVFLALTFFVGIASKQSEDEDREWWARYGGWILIAAVVWAVASFLVVLGPPLMSYAWYAVYPAGGVVGVVTALLGRSGKMPAKDQPATGVSSLIMRYALPLGAIAFAVVFVVFLSLGTNFLLDLLARVWVKLWPATANWVHRIDSASTLASKAFFPSTRETLTFIFLTGGLGFLMAKLINTNKFSHHAMYRDRIIRAYLGASNADRHPNLFTGFDSADNLLMHELRPEFFHTGSFSVPVANSSVTENRFNEFLSKLRDPKHPASEHLRKKLSADTLARLENSVPGSDSDHHVKLLGRAIIKELNEILLQPEPPLPEAALGAPNVTTTQNLVSNPVLRNRKLLEEAFKGDIRPALLPPHRPLHIINMTLNLVRGQKLAWQQRKAESFTVSPLHCGSFQIPADKNDDPIYGAYRRTNEYGGSKGMHKGGISLGTAMAISGAAVSPNMGYYSSPVVTFLMTLLNVRLGWWLGNPGPSGSPDVYRFAYPKSAARPIIAEALGQTDDKSEYIYLSDGGHFENLGLYEMVLRRCRFILLSDAGGDPEFQYNDLGNAVHKIRTDFGIPIDFEEVKILPRKDNRRGAFCAIGTIRYSKVDGPIDKIDADGNPVLDDKGNVVPAPAPDGTIVYIKPVFYGDEPRDIYHYGITHPTFPHESTGDQWFSEAQFESYRKLGSLMIDRICRYDIRQPADRAFADRGLIDFLEKAKLSATT
ncbi:MAG TPA: patatin-like phospholipase family protein [Pyrinomonadaceae bacterium]